MKKWRIITIYVLVQGIVGGLILFTVDKSNYFDGPIGAYGEILTFIGVPLGLILLSLIIYLLQKDEFLKEALAYAFYCTIVFWIIALGGMILFLSGN